MARWMTYVSARNLVDFNLGLGVGNPRLQCSILYSKTYLRLFKAKVGPRDLDERGHTIKSKIK